MVTTSSLSRKSLLLSSGSRNERTQKHSVSGDQTVSRYLLASCFVMLVLGLAHSTLAAEPVPPLQPGMNKAQPFTGKVLPVSKALEKMGVKNDADNTGLALVADDGTLYTLVKDDASRLFFLDKQLHDRSVKVTARVVPGTQMLKLEKVQTVVKGKLHDIDYWCENCQFPNTQPGPCMCCGGETVFRERLAKQP